MKIHILPEDSTLFARVKQNLTLLYHISLKKQGHPPSILKIFFRNHSKKFPRWGKKAFSSQKDQENPDSLFTF